MPALGENRTHHWEQPGASYRRLNGADAPARFDRFLQRTPLLDAVAPFTNRV